MWRLIVAQIKEAVPAEAVTEGAAQAPGAAAPQGNPLTSMLPMIIAFIAIMYFLMIRPQQKREKERREMLASVSKGDAVVTSGGMCGEVVKLSENTVTLCVDKDVNIEFVRSAIAQVTSRTGNSTQKK